MRFIHSPTCHAVTRLSAVAPLLLVAVLPLAAQDSSARCSGTSCRGDGAPRRIAVTPHHLATAFRDDSAGVLLHRAREARVQQDSTLVSYDAMAHLRLSIGMGAGRIARQRVLFRMENASRVRWHRDIGVRLEVKGLRGVYPGVSRDAANMKMRSNIPEMMLLPYYPGQEALLIGWGSADAEVDETEVVHPLAAGAEAYYTYESGEIAQLTGRDGSVIRLRELQVRPRRVGWNLIVGSLWLDVDRGQLVRAAYRPAEPLDIWAQIAADPSNDPGLPSAVRRLLSPLRAQVSTVVVEYGLHEGRFWLPRLQSIEGHAQATFMRVAFRSEQMFRYAAVNALSLDSMPPIVRSASGQTIGAPCDTGSTYITVETLPRARFPVLESVPCDHEALANSPELSGSIYSAGEDEFDEGAQNELIAKALGLDAQPVWAPQAPVVEYGLHLTRFNRIEGLSLGARATQQLGAGFVADGTLRLGIADREPNAELGIARTNLTHTLRIGVYNRLVAADDWGNPLSFGSSMSALLWGRDDGFYYRASGMDLTGVRDGGAHLTWRFFLERQRTATVENSFSFAKLARDIEFQPNIVSQHGVWGGGSLRATRTLGLDPRGWRALGDLRLEAAGGDATHGRAAMDLTLSRALGPTTSGAPLAALTLSSGSSAGDLPPQRRWILGGAHTVRGHPAGAASGDAYWFGQLEVAQELFNVGRVSLFGDAGWAGFRTRFLERATFGLRSDERDPGFLSGIGVGYSLLDGLLRLDIAKGVHPRRAWRTTLRLEARF